MVASLGLGVAVDVVDREGEGVAGVLGGRVEVGVRIGAAPAGGRADVAVLADDGRVRPLRLVEARLVDVPADLLGAPLELDVDFREVLGRGAEVEGVAASRAC